MISVRVNGQRFQVRAASIVIHDGHVLLHRAADDDYWSLPGGRVEIGEAASATVVREMKEELGEAVTCGPLVHVVENFFDIKGEPNHEIGFYFQVALSEGSPLVDKARSYSGLESDLRLMFQWHALLDLGSIDLRPAFLRNTLSTIPLVFSHVVHPGADDV
ncbi:NUDIX hydrolase [Uliginosibacterium paludis]|uniref:NUDIX hydrolase n=1 Tax=Uliginosibacterium paludis TaxID=1615952 RepID=UPI0031F5F43F